MCKGDGKKRYRMLKEIGLKQHGRKLTYDGVVK
jgi:hypothetical protein